ncbi:hypothetical protein SERLA73DRAFT_86680 [Serpula lacrymans var. lacrymans S7.3]|uniref:Acyl-protein thioesterase 1 n=2 Tax=Serpula lacrymans var. lacrymans TaxID=341189 RepID=F8PR95_SERL3|nr:uncharacterized protein SERLADRAFT_414252 [Serpula lacrymans var. lacrymans S7.9]EGO02386.1 hypothetical protein SERLA73DRAFT_86680 [Serpula lacrymans var. lacrymans S7.3]EGO28113.1 hypothetical protein SERLADRAFT_414252 [Serpula lacrymans var. lacrymans S7.9]
MALAPLKFLTVSPLSKHTATVIFIHGLGDSGHGWKPVADMFRPELSHVKWVLPHSPERAVTANMGIEMPSWFDVYSFGFNTTEDAAGMLVSLRALDALIKAEVDAGIPPSRIVVGGFSQGGAMSLLTGLTGRGAREAWGGEGWKLAGVAVMSGWLPLKDQFKRFASPYISSTPLFWGHGTLDPLVKYQLGRDSAEFLTGQLGISIAEQGKGVNAGLDFRSYEGMGHSTCAKELDDLKEFIRKTVPQE